MQAAGFAAAPLAGHLSDQMGRRQIVMSSTATSAVVLLLMIFVGKSASFVLLIGFLGFFLFAVRAVLQAWLLDATPPSMGGTGIGVMFGSQALGSAVGPVIAGSMADAYGLISAFYFCAITIVIANMFIFITPVPNQPPRRTAVPT
jgi:MFS family permease